MMLLTVLLCVCSFALGAIAVAVLMIGILPGFDDRERIQ